MKPNFTLAGITALAFIAACVAHEAVGHAGTCLLLGGRVTLLSSVFFSGTGAGPLVDAGGPLMNVLAGWVCLRAARTRPEGSASRIFFGLAMLINFSWCAGCLIESALTGEGDWGFVLSRLHLEPRLLWRVALGVAAVFLYRTAVRKADECLPKGVPLVWPYFLSAAVCCISVLFYTGPRGPALHAAVVEGLGTPLALLFLAFQRRSARGSDSPFQSPRSTGWAVASVLVTVLFFLTLGHGWTATPLS